MKNSNTYKRYRFPSEIIQYAVWLYYRFNLSHRDIEDLLAERGINVTHEAIRLWCNRFGPKYATRLKSKHRGFGDTFFIDEVFIKIDGNQFYLWRAVDQDGEVVDVFLQRRRDGAAAKRFFKRLLKNHRDEPRKIVTDKLRSYSVAHRELIPDTKYKKNKHPISTIPSKIRAGIRVAIQPWGIRNLTDFPRYPQYRLKRLLLVLIPAGQSCQNQPPGMPTTCHYFYSQQFGE